VDRDAVALLVRVLWTRSVRFHPAVQQRRAASKGRPWLWDRTEADLGVWVLGCEPVGASIHASTLFRPAHD